QNPREFLLAVRCRDEHVVRPLDPRLDTDFPSGFGDGNRRRERQNRGVGRWEVGPEEYTEPDPAGWRDPLAVESSATAGLSVRYHHPIRFAVHCKVARSGVRTRQTLVIVDCEGCIQPVFDGRTAV